MAVVYLMALPRFPLKPCREISQFVVVFNQDMYDVIQEYSRAWQSPIHHSDCLSSILSSSHSCESHIIVGFGCGGWRAQLGGETLELVLRHNSFSVCESNLGEEMDGVVKCWCQEEL